MRSVKSAYLTLLLISDASMDSPSLPEPALLQLTPYVVSASYRGVSWKKVDTFSSLNSRYKKILIKASKIHRQVDLFMYTYSPTRKFLQRCLDRFTSA